MTVSKNDYKILAKFYEYECTNELKSITIDKISQLTNLSKNKIRNTMKHFKELDYIQNGALEHNAKTFYITRKGIEKLKELIN